MDMLARLVRKLGAKLTGKRTWTPDQVRDMLDRGRLDEAAVAVASLTAETPDRALMALCLSGEVAFRRHDDLCAERLFREALAQAPGLADAHYGLSLVMLARKEAESAVRHAQFAVNNGTAPRLAAQLGLCHLELGNYSKAESSLTRAVQLDANDKASWNNLGIVKRARGHFNGARQAFARALALDPRFERAAANAQLLEEDIKTFGVIKDAQSPMDTSVAEDFDPRLESVRKFAAASNLTSAIDACEALCIEHPDELQLVVELWTLYRQHGDAQSGIDALRAYHARHTKDMEALGALGKALVEVGEYKIANPMIGHALKARPDDVSLLLAMGEVRWYQGLHAEAGALIEKAHALAPSLQTKGRLAASLGARCRYAEALELLDEIVAEHPVATNDVIGIRVDALTALGRHDEVLPELNAQIALNPHDPGKRFYRASINLLNENFAEGWDDYKYRNLQSSKHLRVLPFPIWDGSPLEGKTILIIAEQGLGDQVMFVSCLPDVLRMNPARVIVEAIDRVAPSVARSFPACEVIATKQDAQLEWVREVGHVDFFMLMGDLPRLFRRRREDFPVHCGYFKPEPARVVHWQEALAPLGRRPRIGVSWRGGTELTRKTLRTMAVTDMAPLFAACDATWVCLQYGDVVKDLDAASSAGLKMHYWPESIENLDEFSALIGALDLVVTVCNTTVHYAGAVGIPVWVLAPKVPEWRYGLHSDSMPWYPSSRLFRQTQATEWTQVVGHVAQELSCRFPARVEEACGEAQN